jgi:hypothetical protein
VGGGGGGVKDLSIFIVYMIQILPLIPQKFDITRVAQS